MIHRRLIGSIVALALLSGSGFVPMARAACAFPKSSAAACPRCASEPSTTAANLSADRSCCAAPSSLSEREPATVTPDRTGDHRVVGAVLPLSAVPVVIHRGPARSQHPSPAPPGASPPLLRTTILLI